MQGIVRRARYRWWQGWTKGEAWQRSAHLLHHSNCPYNKPFHPDEWAGVYISASATFYTLSIMFFYSHACARCETHTREARSSSLRFLSSVQECRAPKAISLIQGTLLLFPSDREISVSIDKTIFNFQFFCILHISNINVFGAELVFFVSRI